MVTTHRLDPAWFSAIPTNKARKKKKKGVCHHKCKGKACDHKCNATIEFKMFWGFFVLLLKTCLNTCIASKSTHLSLVQNVFVKIAIAKDSDFAVPWPVVVAHQHPPRDANIEGSRMD